MFKNAKIGDEVWSPVYGWGKITSTGLRTYPIRIKFNNNIFGSYKLNGKEEADLNPSIFWNQFKIPETAYKKALPNLKIDSKVMVKNNGSGIWEKRYFAEWTEDGKIKCWNDGKTSWVTRATEVWDDYICLQ